jgi:hypothetical protein
MKFLLALLLVLCTPGPASAQYWTGNLNLTLGSKMLESDWGPVDEHSAFGFSADFRRPHWPINIALGFLASQGEETLYNFDLAQIAKLEATTLELRGGVRKIWEPTPTMRPFLGGGLAVIWAELERSRFGASESDDDLGLGLWINGGVYWTLARRFNLGFELGYSTADVTLLRRDIDAGGWNGGVLLGYNF